MTRPPRLEYAGARYHVINRGNYRRAVFSNEVAAEAFERTLGEAAVKFGWKISAYVVMKNHFHLALETPEPNLSLGMKWLQGTWVSRSQPYRRPAGRPFQGRFKSLVIEDGEGFRRVCDYIHLNPVRARVVSVTEVGTYRRSSLWHYLEGRRAPWMDGKGLLNAVGIRATTRSGWKSYVRTLGLIMGDKREREQHTAKQLSRGWCIGSAEFRKTMLETMGERRELWRSRRSAGLESDAVKTEQTRGWEAMLVASARLAKIDLAALPAKKSASEKVLLAAVLKTSTAVSNVWLAERLQMGQPASVSQFVRRHLMKPESEKAIRRLLSKVKV
jgi:putative transposase